MNLYKNIEIHELLRLVRLHDDEAFDELVIRYTPMMRRVVADLSISSIDKDEMFCECCVALHVAAVKYDLQQSEVTFGLYARICIRNHVISLLRKQNSESVFSDFDVEQLAEEESLENSIVRRETADDILQRAPKLLSDLEYQVLLLHIHGYKTAQIAAALGKTAKSVDNAKFRLFRRLREELENPSEK